MIKLNIYNDVTCDSFFDKNSLNRTCNISFEKIQCRYRETMLVLTFVFVNVGVN